MAESSAQPRNAILYRFGLYEADVRSGELRREGHRIKLQEQPFQVLVALVERQGEVVTREDLRQRLWPEDTFVDFDHSLNTAVNKLREALRDSAQNPRFIETLARRGYRFIAPVEAAESELRPAGCADPLGRTPQAQARGEAPLLESAGARPDLPNVNRALARGLFALIQGMYLAFYLVSLARLSAIADIVDGTRGNWSPVVVILVLVTAALGIPVRLYLLTAALFDYPRLGEKFQRLFRFLLPLDGLWALAPFLLLNRIGLGLALAATAGLLYVPFSERTLIRMSYPTSGG